MKDEIIQGKLFLVGAFALAGTSVVAARFVTDQIGVFTIAAMSLAIALVLLIPVCFRRLKTALKNITLLNIFDITIQALFGMFLFRFFLLNGITRTSSLEAGILTGATPAITAFLAWLILREKVDRKTILGICCTVAGVLLVQGITNRVEWMNREHLVGNLFVLCAAASESMFNIISRSAATRLKRNGTPLDPLVQTTFVTFFALMFCLIPAAFEQPIERLGNIGFSGWIALGWYGFVVTALAYLCWYAGIKRSGAFTAAAFSGLMPLTSMILSVCILRESTTILQWIGGGFVILGMMLIGRKRNTN